MIDGLLAATALHHNLTIVSRNVNDLAGTGVPVLNPWEHRVSYWRDPAFALPG